MDLLQTIILGFIQGVTEWLPISSTGHLRIAEHFFGLSVPLLFDVMLHVGTLIVTLIFFHKEIINILSALAKRDFKTEYGRLIPVIIVGTVPTILIGFFLGDALDTYFSSVLALGVGFIVGGVVLYSSKLGDEKRDNVTYVYALLIGAAQGIAIIPSISRSGLTIAVALLFGLRREKAFKFSFLLSVPAIIGALGLTFYQQLDALTVGGIGWTEIAVGVVVSIVVSFIALKLLQRVIACRKFYLFAIYCFIIGALLVGLSLFGF